MNLAALGSWREDDFSDQGTKGFRRLPAAVRIAEGVGQALHTEAVKVGAVRMNVRHVHGRLSKAGDDLRLLPFKVVHARFHGWLVHAVLDGRDDTRNRLLDLGKRLLIRGRLHAPVAVQPVHFLRIGAHRLRDCFRRDEPLFQAGQHAGLDLVEVMDLPLSQVPRR